MLLEERQHNLATIFFLKFFKGFYFLSSYLQANLVENDITAILMNRSHAPGEEGHLRKEVPRGP